MNDDQKQYWHNVYTDSKNVGTDDYKKNVFRTKKGKPLDEKIWQKTLEYICRLVAVDKRSSVIELCCGNGEIIGNLSPKPREAIGVDYSKQLLDQMMERFDGSVKAIYSDALRAKFSNSSADIVIIYAGIQYFSEQDTIRLVKNSLDWLKPGGRLLLGDVPDELKKWEYINKPEYRTDYINRVLNNRPLIGYWYHPEFFKALANYFADISVDIIDQPTYQINASFRYDVLIKKLRV